MLGGANYSSLSGVVVTEAVEDGDMRASFVLRVETGDDLRSNELTITVVSAGRRARRMVRSARVGRRVSVWGKIVQLGDKLGIFADWIEYGFVEGVNGQ